MDHSKEYILCAAVYVDDGRDHNPRNFNYPRTGLVFAGPRHGDCYQVLYDWLHLLPQAEQVRLRQEQEDGFITSTSRFVGRKEAFRLARDAGQLDGRTKHHPLNELCSEDLY